MPILHWLNKDQAVKTAQQSAYRLLEEMPELSYGDAYVSNDDSAEKPNVGELWVEASNGKCLFIMAVEQDGQGRDVRQQILSVIS